MKKKCLISIYLFSSIILFAQEIPKDKYLEYIPLEHSKIIEQTAASRDLNLFGDSHSLNYVDKNPVDGIDDNRNKVLSAMGLKFSPYLVLNSTNIPMDIRAFMENRKSFPLFIDVWNITRSTPELVDNDIIDFAKLGESDCKLSDLPEKGENNFLLLQEANNDDCKLLGLVNEFNPLHPQSPQYKTGSKSMENYLFKVMYFNLPGEGPETWEKEFKNQLTKQLPIKYQHALKTYVHPFIKDFVNNNSKKFLGYELILQYWFFYPYNDGGNNHEGDWEHINVVVSPKNLVEKYLSETEIENVLNGNWIGKNNTDTELVIKRIEYYFHHQVMPLDFSYPNVYNSREKWEKQFNEMTLERFGESKLVEQIRYRAYRDENETIVNTHPFINVGGDNKGFDQVMSMPGGTNRDSHGSYPFEGLFRNIGPAGASEQMYEYVDHKKYFLRTKNKKENLPEEFQRGGIVGFNSNELIEIVPDWERVIDLIPKNKKVRQKWSWLVLPLRWGYPATESPFAGIVKHADTGNQGDIGPQFTTWWNTSMDAEGVHVFNPNIIPPIFPLGFQDSFDNNLGFLNLTYPVLLNLPPLDVVWRVAVYPFRSLFKSYDPVYYPDDQIPFRFFDIGVGYSNQKLDDVFKDVVVNPNQVDEFLNTFINHVVATGDTNTIALSIGQTLTRPISPVYQVTFHIGDNFTSENSLRNFRSNYKMNAVFNNISDYIYESELNFWEYFGSIRYSLTTSNLRPFIKIGYGWSWYRVENARANGKKFKNPNSNWFNKPSFKSFSDILPNTFHFGLGIEAIIIKSYAGLDLSIKAEYSYFTQKLGINFSQISLDELSLLYNNLNEIPQNRSVYRHSFITTLSLGF